MIELLLSSIRLLGNNSKEVLMPLMVALLASMTQALGISLQRRSHLEQPTVTLFRRPLWVTGFLIYTLSNLVGSTCTIGYLPIVILAPVGAIGLVFNAVFAKLVLGDPFSSKTIMGTALIVTGAMLVAGFGVVPEPNHTLEDLIQLYKRPSFIIYFTLIEFCTCFGLLTTHIIEYGLKRNTHWQIKYPDLKMWLGISFGVFGANISSQAMLFAKSGLELLILTVFHGDNQFIYPLTWVLVIALIFTAVLQLYYLNRGVQLCDTIILVPLNFCSFNVSCLFNGLVYYNQWDRLFWWQVVLVLIGIAILVWGVLIISFHSTTTTTTTSSSSASKVTSSSPPPSHHHFVQTPGSWWQRTRRILGAKHTQADETTPLIPSS
ncbi:magnesium transporter NIPA-domain-containing protein [Chlamydoabsidia padenii]|nr:magnesium transporter NIPA-domain-containing protein [Chlamydoabsidia padenii]